MPDDTLKPPEHLSAAAAEWWRAVTRAYALEPHHAKLLQAAAESWDRAQEAREAIAEHGLVVEGRYGQPVANPAAVIEKEARALFARLVAQLDLDSNPEEA
jgi:P27 family predicted phage terminase small subunit